MAVRKLSFVAILLLGCSGAGNQDLFAPTGQDVAATEPTPSAPATPPAAPPSSDPTTPPAAPPPSDPGPAKNDPPEPAEPACTPEAEPNDTVKAATRFTTSFCGTIGSKGDIDNGSVVAPADARKMKYSASAKDGRVVMYVLADGFPIFFEDGEIRVIPGTTYTFQMQQNSGAHPSYEVDVTFE
jgi:hypothetical protein